MSKLTVEFPDGQKSEYVHAYGLTYDLFVLDFVPNKDLKSHIEDIRHLDIREDDIYLATYPKSGTHWVWEILTMLKSGSADYCTKTKHSASLDFLSPETIRSIPSPRVLNCHYPCKLTPKEIVQKGIKIVHVMRNPKDGFVSYYQHIKTMGGESFSLSFQDFLPQMLGDFGVCSPKMLFNDLTESLNSDLWCPWYKYVKEWERFLKQHPEQILNIYFEDLKENSVREIIKINDFLGTKRSDDVIRKIAEACDFTKLKKADREIKVTEDYMKDRGTPCLFRKGEVGDWKHHFTVAQNEKMDEWLEDNLVDTDLKFRYTL